MNNGVNAPPSVAATYENISRRSESELQEFDEMPQPTKLVLDTMKTCVIDMPSGRKEEQVPHYSFYPSSSKTVVEKINNLDVLKESLALLT
ncbi:hypothetical protein [Candidatus Protochlamydia phocaeensis]|uniref:hypothetical protein n=1 Tax=Candidatus Protochlamydia phocaeensis TaxID=1414722 RepID=UPI0008386199|nr:hypothetical protein [Candidatus Protochlamydia phocaeensis]